MQDRELLQKALQNKNMMVLYRDDLMAPETAGIPVAVENELVVLHRQTNFALDGYAALRTGDITEAEQMDDVPFLKKVLTAEKVYDAVKAPGFCCRNWQTLCSGLWEPGTSGPLASAPAPGRWRAPICPVFWPACRRPGPWRPPLECPATPSPTSRGTLPRRFGRRTGWT